MILVALNLTQVHGNLVAIYSLILYHFSFVAVFFSYEVMMAVED